MSWNEVEMIQGKERRKTERMDVSYEVFLTTPEGVFSGRCRDVSMFGMGIEADKSPAVGSVVEFSIIIPKANTNFRGKAEVRHVTPTGSGGGCVMGLEFTEGHEKGLPFAEIAGRDTEHAISTSVSIDADIETCYRLLSNVERFSDWDSGILSTKVLNRHPDERPRQVEFSRSFLIATIRHTDEFSYDDARHELSWKSVGGSKELVKNEGGYTFKRISDNSTLMTFHINITLALVPAPRIVSFFSSIAVRKEMRNFKKLVEDRGKKARSS
jgi:uncharacterized membrane protein